MTRASILFATALAAACSTPPLERPALDLAPFTAFDTAAFPGAAKVLAGFAPADEDRTLRVGDAALFGVEIARNGEIERVLLLLEVRNLVRTAVQRGEATVVVRPSFTAKHTTRTVDRDAGTERTDVHEVVVHPVEVALVRHDADGAPQQTSDARLFEEALVTGFWPDTEATATADERALTSTLTQCMQDLARDDAVLLDLLFRVVERPSLWSVVTNLGVSALLVWTPDRHSPTTVDVPGLTAARVLPLRVWVNDGTALWVDLLVARPNGATMACGGLVGAIARHPKEPGRMAVVRLLATRRGPVPSR